jgi:hypothetical protein
LEVIYVKNEQQGGKVRLITDVTNTAIRKDEMAACL